MRSKILKKFYNSRMCVVCGLENDLGMDARFFELENGDVAGVCRTKQEHQSYPGRMHGGMSAALLDETLGRAMNIDDPDGFAVTIELSLAYRRPVPLDHEIVAVGRITKNLTRLFEAEGEIYIDDGPPAVTAKGRYYKMPIGQITDGEGMEGEYFLDSGPAPEELRLFEED